MFVAYLIVAFCAVQFTRMLQLNALLFSFRSASTRTTYANTNTNTKILESWHSLASNSGLNNVQSNELLELDVTEARMRVKRVAGNRAIASQTGFQCYKHEAACWRVRARVCLRVRVRRRRRTRVSRTRMCTLQ